MRTPAPPAGRWVGTIGHGLASQQHGTSRSIRSLIHPPSHPSSHRFQAIILEQGAQRELKVAIAARAKAESTEYDVYSESVRKMGQYTDAEVRHPPTSTPPQDQPEITTSHAPRSPRDHHEIRLCRSLARPYALVV